MFLSSSLSLSLLPAMLSTSPFLDLNRALTFLLHIPPPQQVDTDIHAPMKTTHTNNKPPRICVPIGSSRNPHPSEVVVGINSVDVL